MHASLSGLCVRCRFIRRFVDKVVRSGCDTKSCARYILASCFLILKESSCEIAFLFFKISFRSRENQSSEF